MARGGQWSDSNLKCLCPVCERQIDIFNDDVHFSMELHMQSHKPFEMISEEINKEVKEAKVSSNWESNCVSTFYCPQCKEDIKIFNNDISTSLRLHSQKHKSGGSVTLSEDQLFTSSIKSRNSSTKDKCSLTKQLSMRVTSVLYTIFGTMPQGLKSHRGYITENNNGEHLCCLCNVQIEHINSIFVHLKTKLHEDKINVLLKKISPNSLHQIIEFVSLYGSNLFCNLCRCKIDLCSTNPRKTIINIIAHNTSKAHLNKKPNTESSWYSDQTSITVKCLAQINSLVDENKHFIYCKMEPQIMCKLCDKKDSELLKDLTAHFTSKVHKKSFKATSILDSSKSLHFAGKEKHNFIISKGSIWCTICKCYIEVNLETLVSHLKEKNYVPPEYEHLDLSSRESNLSLDTPSTSSNWTMSKDQYVTPPMRDFVGQETTNNKTVDLNMLLKSLPPQLQSINYLIQNEHGEVTCLICNCIIPANTHNLETHLMGKNHIKKDKTTPIITTTDINQSNNTELCKKPLIFNGNTLQDSNTSDGNRNYSTANDDILLNNLMEKQRKESKIPTLAQIRLIFSDPVAYDNQQYLKKHGEKFFCTLCSMAFNEKTYNASLSLHLSGKKN